MENESLIVGNSNWAVKANSLLGYAVGETSGYYVPREFTFTRNSTATYTDENGIIQTAAANIARVQNNALLLEPQTTALNQFSEQIDNAYWTKANCTVTANQTASPSGYVDAELVLDDTSNNQHVITRSIAVTSGNKYTASFFLKAAGYTTAAIRMGVGSLWTGGTGPTVEFDFVALTGTVVDGSGVTFTIEDYGNGWNQTICKGQTVKMTFTKYEFANETASGQHTKPK
jgi:hypothetical protein